MIFQYKKLNKYSKNINNSLKFHPRITLLLLCVKRFVHKLSKQLWIWKMMSEMPYHYKYSKI